MRAPKPPKQALAAAALLLALALMLTGCVHTDRGVRLNGDGSGSYTLQLGLNAQLVGTASDQISQQMDAFGAKVKKEGGSYRHFEDRGYTVWEFVRPFDSVARLNALLQETPDTTGTGGSGLPNTGSLSPAATDSFQISEEPGPFTNTFHATGRMSIPKITIPTIPTVPTPTPSASPAPSGTPGPASTPTVPPIGLPTDQAIATLLKDMHASFAVTMPGWVDSQSGGTQDGNTVTYAVHYGESVTIDVKGGGLNTALLYPVAGGALLVALLAGGLAFWLIRRRGRAAAPTPIAAATPAPSSWGGPPGRDAPTPL